MANLNRVQVLIRFLYIVTPKSYREKFDSTFFRKFLWKNIKSFFCEIFCSSNFFPLIILRNYIQPKIVLGNILKKKKFLKMFLLFLVKNIFAKRKFVKFFFVNFFMMKIFCLNNYLLVNLFFSENFFLFRVFS